MGKAVRNARGLLQQAARVVHTTEDFLLSRIDGDAPRAAEGGGDTHMSMKLYVGNLSFQTSSNDLQELFSQAGTVESANVVEDRDTGRALGFGFVEMATKEEGEAAIAQFNGKEFGGRNLPVNEARP